MQYQLRNPSAPPIISVYIQFENRNTSTKVTEETLLAAFAQFSNVILACIKSSSSMNGTETGYAFVHFEASEAGQYSK
jgi:RNA recognition motif-containing protein